MKGYVKNKSPMWTHAMKRAIGPGATVSLDELYKQYGEKHNLAKGKAFVNWLQTVKLTDKDRWEVVLGSTTADATAEVNAAETLAKSKEPKDIPAKQMEIEDIVQLSVRRAREVIPTMTDLKLLKYALEEAGPRAGKDSLCRILRKRIQELKLRHV